MADESVLRGLFDRWVRICAYAVRDFEKDGEKRGRSSKDVAEEYCRAAGHHTIFMPLPGKTPGDSTGTVQAYRSQPRCGLPDGGVRWFLLTTRWQRGAPTSKMCCDTELAIALQPANLADRGLQVPSVMDR
jgi:hypothetical protein